MEQYIPKSALVAEIERRLHFDNNWIEGDKRRQIHQNGISSAYYKKIGSKHTCESLLDFIDNIEVKEVDLEKELNDFIEQQKAFIKDNRVVEYHNGDSFNHIYDLEEIAKHFFELGMRVNNPITAADRGTAEEIIINLKRVEKDYRIDLTREIEWLRNKAQKGE